jgi:hypothetical protein
MMLAKTESAQINANKALKIFNDLQDSEGEGEVYLLKAAIQQEAEKPDTWGKMIKFGMSSMADVKGLGLNDSGQNLR